MTPPFTIFMLLAATARWRALGADAQRTVFDDTLATIFNGYPELRMSHFATGAPAGRCSDVIVWQAHDVAQYHDAIALLHERPFFGAPLFEIVDVIAGIEDDGADAPLPFAALAL